MKKTIISLIFFVILAMIVGLTSAIPNVMEFHGKLFNNSYALVGSQNLSFNFYNVSIGGTSLFQQNVTVVTDSQGVYSTTISGLSMDFTQAYYVELIVNGLTQSPRVNMTSNPYSYRSNITDYVNSTGVLNAPWINSTYGNATYALNTSLQTEIDMSASRGNWTQDKTNYVNQTYGNSTYYKLINPLSFLNSTSAGLLYYSINNPFGFLNMSNVSLLNNQITLDWLNITNKPGIINGTNGLNGTAGTNGTDGSAGTNGTDGIGGEDGYTPVFGVDYFNGSQGIQGETGLTGANGTQGEQGIQGIQGIQGVAGSPGSNGTDGSAGSNGTNGTWNGLADTCGTGNYSYYNGTGFNCRSDADTNTLYLNSTGLSLSGTTFSVIDYLSYTIANSTYYLKSNPFNFYNLTNISALGYQTVTGDQNNYTSSAGYAGAILNLAITGRSNLTATFPNNAITLDATNITSGTMPDARLSAATIITGIQSNVTNVNATANLKALPGVCTGSNFVQNTTTTGVQCAAVSLTGDGNNYTSSLSVTGTSTKSINMGIIGMTALNASFTDIDTDTWVTDKTNVLANITNVNATANLKALPGTCTGSNVVQNTTTTGVQCVAISSGTGNITGTGTSNTLAKFNAAGSINNSNILDDGNTINLTLTTNIGGSGGYALNISNVSGAAYFDTPNYAQFSKYILATSFNGTLAWPYLDGYPAACGAGQAITALGDTITCSGVNATTAGDGNNYTTSISFSGTTTKQLNLAITGRSNLTATFTDTDTDTWVTDKTGVLANITSIGNWSSDKTVVLANISSRGNWTLDKPNYVNQSYANSTYLKNLSNANLTNLYVVNNVTLGSANIYWNGTALIIQT